MYCRCRSHKPTASLLLDVIFVLSPFRLGSNLLAILASNQHSLTDFVDQ